MKRLALIIMIFFTFTIHAASIVINLHHTESKFQIRLPSNPSTGYQWTLKNYNQTLLNVVSTQFNPGPSKLIGAEGTTIYTFEVAKGVIPPRMTPLVFFYARSWEQDKGTTQTVIVNFEGTTSPI